MDGIGGVWLSDRPDRRGTAGLGRTMNGVRRTGRPSPWLAGRASFLPVLALLAVMGLCMPRPVPSAEGIVAIATF